MNGLTHLSLFSGIGGLDLAAEWAGITTVGQCEWADYPTKVLEKHWPNVPRWRDIRTLTKESFYERTGLRTVDVISGGFPCQPFSVAGKQRGKEDDRYLWPEMVRVIKELRPTWVVGENVAGIVKMALPDILSELEACGYRTRTFLIPACAVGARHRRYRVAIVGYSEHNGNEAGAADMENPNSIRRSRPEDVCKQPGRTESKWTGETISDTDNGSWPLRRNGKLPTIKEAGERRSDIRGRTPKYVTGQRRPAQPGLGGVADGISDMLDEALNWLAENAGDLRNDDDYLEWYWNEFVIDHYWDTEPDIPRVAAGITDRVGRLKALGNAVVPQQFYPIFRGIGEIEGK